MFSTVQKMFTCPSLPNAPALDGIGCKLMDRDPDLNRHSSVLQRIGIDRLASTLQQMPRLCRSTDQWLPRDGDMVAIDRGSPEVQLSDVEFEKCRAKWQPRVSAFGSRYQYAQQVEFGVPRAPPRIGRGAAERHAMRISGYFLSVALFGFGLTTAYAIDGTRSSANTAPAVGAAAPQGALVSRCGNLRSAFLARLAGGIDAALKSLEELARKGDVGAAWELGRMYAEGDGVKRNDQRAFEYFSGLADSHADEETGTARAPFIANAFVELGRYYFTGIPNYIKPDAVHAYEMFNYAATYFGDPDAQYHLGRMYLDGQGVGKNTKQAVRWLFAAANKGQYQAQAVFGSLLFTGQSVPRNAPRGLMWLILARDAATPEETWIADLYDAASKQVTADELEAASTMASKLRSRLASRAGLCATRGH
jgi:uncharacterized protein